MTLKNRLKQVAILFALILFTLLPSVDAQPDADYENLNLRVLESIDRGLEWLRLQQGSDGLFHDHPGLTALAITTFLKHPQDKFAEVDHPFIQKAIKALLDMQQPSGAIYDIDKQPVLPNYNTSLALMALSSTKNPEYNEPITKAQDFIKSLQVPDTDDVYFGGIGYGSRETVHDLSNLNFAIQALKESGSDDEEVWDKAIQFLERCQNNSETNDRDWSGDDGGFIYAPDGESKAGTDENGRPRSYASMTYAGVLSFVYANVDKNDPRVQAAVDWLKKYFTVEENYGMGKQGLFYNYHTMAKALKIYGEPTITDAKGIPHDWYRELAEKLITEQVLLKPTNEKQNPQGYWQNEESRWMERDPVLVTSYAILALATAYPQ